MITVTMSAQAGRQSKGERKGYAQCNQRPGAGSIFVLWHCATNSLDSGHLHEYNAYITS